VQKRWYPNPTIAKFFLANIIAPMAAFGSAAVAPTSSSSPVFVFIHANGCGFCSNFAVNHWKQTQKELVASQPDLRIQSVTWTTMSDRSSYDQTRFPAGLVFWAEAFPTFLIIPGELWDRAQSDGAVTLFPSDGVDAMNMTVMGGKPVSKRSGGYSFDTTGVMKWSTIILGQAKYQKPKTRTGAKTVAKTTLNPKEAGTKPALTKQSFLKPAQTVDTIPIPSSSNYYPPSSMNSIIRTELVEPPPTVIPGRSNIAIIKPVYALTEIVKPIRQTSLITPPSASRMTNLPYIATPSSHISKPTVVGLHSVPELVKAPVAANLSNIPEVSTNVCKITLVSRPSNR
jgi:hypothetical protein